MKIKEEILTVMHETLPFYRVTSRRKISTRKLTSEHCMISCISYGLLYDWPSHLREQINRTVFSSGTVMGSSFVLFDVSMKITLRQFRSGKSG